MLLNRVQVGVVLAGLLLGCSLSEQTDPATLFSVPDNFPQPTYHFETNPITPAGVELGKALFNETLLSRDGSISCAECHQQSAGFTHHGHDVSHGIDNQKGTRNSLPLQNLAWEKEFFWDGGVGDLDLFPIAPIENPLEMDEKTGKVLEKLRKTENYPVLFKKAFGTSEITGARFLQALSQFMLTLVSANSNYDKYVRNEGVTFSEDEKQGLALFQQKCASCHTGTLFTDHSYRNNGLTIQGSMDVGRFRITENPTDKYKFKVPSLRNVAVTKPYMHDGRFYTLDDVLNHYAEGVQATPNLDPLLIQNGRRGIPLTEVEKRQIIAFLNTLTDQEFLTNKRFAP
ncbi:MAG: cytochrome c peroxidase [Spirosomataceae bacterium]